MRGRSSRATGVRDLRRRKPLRPEAVHVRDEVRARPDVGSERRLARERERAGREREHRRVHGAGRLPEQEGAIAEDLGHGVEVGVRELHEINAMKAAWLPARESFAERRRKVLLYR